MKRRIYWFLYIVTCIIFMLLISACGQKPNNGSLNEVTMKEYYSKEDFQSIVIGKSSYQDVYNIAPPEFIQLTSYGGLCEYPMIGGGIIRIKFYGKEMLVGAIEIDSSSQVDG